MSLAPIRSGGSTIQTEAQVTAYLTSARDRLALALEATGPQAVANIRAELATVQEATKQLGLSKEIREDAAEMVRRAEYALGKAIRKGQEEGTVARPGDIGGIPPNARTRGPANNNISRPTEFATPGDLYGNGAGIYALSDDVSAEQFDEALAEARAEGNLSRANIVRKVQGIKDGPLTRQARADLIADLAREGLTSKQMAVRVGVTDSTVRDIARQYQVDIPADRVTARTVGIDPRRVMSGIEGALEGAAYSIRQIDMSDIGQEEALTWVDSLTTSLNTLRREVKQIKESYRG